jgi:hypothetical protein
VGSRSLVPHRTASNVPAKVPGSRDSEVRPPVGKGRRRCRCRSTGTRTLRVLHRPKGATKLRGQHLHRAAKPKGANPGGSSAATVPWSRSRRPNARRRRGQRSRAELHHPRLDSSNQRGDRRRRGGLLRGSRLLHHHCPHGGRRHRCRRRESRGREPHPCHRKHRQPETYTRGPRGPRQGRRSPRLPGAGGNGATSRK